MAKLGDMSLTNWSWLLLGIGVGFLALGYFSDGAYTFLFGVVCVLAFIPFRVVDFAITVRVKKQNEKLR